MIHLLFDTETTNLVHNSLQPLTKQPRIIEFFGLFLDDKADWAEVGTVHSYINPGVPIPEKVTEITRITDAMLVGKPSWKEFQTSVSAALQRADVVVAHNLSYDMTVVEFEYERNGGLHSAGTMPPWPERRICTVEATEHIKGFRLSLTNLHLELFGEGFEKAHSAENDVRAMARCYKELVRRGEI
jgi:DNA polymerase III epsilon subunit-like protein